MCGLTAHALFVDKAAALRSLCDAETDAGANAGATDRAKIYVLVGYDTWIRITDPKYYPDGQVSFEISCVEATHTRTHTPGRAHPRFSTWQLNPVLSRLFDLVDVVVASRPIHPKIADETAETAQAQAASVSAISADITRGRLHFLEISDPEIAQLSSTVARSALGAKDVESAEAAVPPSVREYIAAKQLYGHAD